MNKIKRKKLLLKTYVLVAENVVQYTLAADVGTPVQVLVTNEGVASGLLTLSCRADLPRVDRNPIADPATGAQGPIEALPEPPGPKPAGVNEDVSQKPSDQPEAGLMSQ